MYVRGLQRGGLGRLARANGLSRSLRGLRGTFVKRKYLSSAKLNGIVAARLGQMDYGDSSGGLTTQDAALISQAITTGGVLASKALTPVPTVTYNPATGFYSATGGATLPSSIATSQVTSELSAYLPLILLGGGAILLISMMKK
jgi:hypothetical protein